MDLREARFKARISQWELSKKTGVHQSRISLIENGHSPNENERQKLIESLGLISTEMEWPT